MTPLVRNYLGGHLVWTAPGANMQIGQSMYCVAWDGYWQIPPCVGGVQSRRRLVHIPLTVNNINLHSLSGYTLFSAHSLLSA